MIGIKVRNQKEREELRCFPGTVRKKRKENSTLMFGQCNLITAA